MNAETATGRGSLKRLNDAVLKPGDIVLTTTTAAVNKAIQIVTHSDISNEPIASGRTTNGIAHASLLPMMMRATSLAG